MRGFAARLLGVTAAFCVLAGASYAGAAATVAPSLRLATFTTSGDPDLVTVVPPAMAAQTVPASAFRVQQNGVLRHISVNRIVDEGLDVHIVLDTEAANTDLAAEQSAASDLLRTLPGRVRTAIETSGGLVHAPQPGRTTALQDLAQAQPDPAATPFETETTLSSIANSPIGRRNRIIVLLTSCRADNARGFPALAGTLAHGRQQWDLVATGHTCAPSLAAQARSSGGLGVTGIGTERLAEAVDTVTYDILGQYRLTVHDARTGSPLMVDVNYGGRRAATTLALPGVTTAVTEDRTTPFPKLLAVLSGLILVATAAGYVLALRRRSGLQPA